MKKLFLLFAFIIAAMCTAPLEAMNKRDRAETKEDDRRVAPKTRQTTMLEHVRPVNHPGVPAPKPDAFAARNNFQDDTPQAPVRDAVMPDGTWRELQPNPQWAILQRLHQINQHNL